MDETYIKIKGVWKYLYRAVDKEGKTIDFLLTAKRDKAAAMRFFEKAMQDNGIPVLRYPVACCGVVHFFILAVWSCGKHGTKWLIR